jgi:hypothetical protein
MNGHHFDTIEVIEVESQNTHTERDFQDAFKNIVEGLEMVHTTGGDYFEGDDG